MSPCGDMVFRPAGPVCAGRQAAKGHQPRLRVGGAKAPSSLHGVCQQYRSASGAKEPRRMVNVLESGENDFGPSKTVFYPQITQIAQIFCLISSLFL